MAILLSVVFGLLLYPIHVAGQTMCDTDGQLEVSYNAANSVFTCTGAGAADTINWILRRSNGNIDIATCNPDSCNNPYKPQFEASRPADDRSTLTVNISTRSYLQYVQGQTIVCRANPTTGSPRETQCAVDIVGDAVPSVTCDAHYNTGTSSPWTVSGNCSVSGAYLSYYTCNLIQTSPTTKNQGSGKVVVTSTSGSGGKNKTGFCQVIVPYPDVTGVYSYKMAVTPGRQEVSVSFGGQRSFEIKRPSTPPSHNCPQYVAEYGTNCTCTATDLGQPAGFFWWTSTRTNHLSLSNVNKNDNGATYTCEVIWNEQRKQSVIYTLQVAYGPSSVSITHPPFPYDTNGRQRLTLTCSASDANPAPTFTWVKGSANNVVGQGRTYSFRPQLPGDANSVFACRVLNSITGTIKQDNTTLTLDYPPTQDPVITITPTPSNSGGHLYQGDRVTLTCSVTGGKPFYATILTFQCPGKQDSPDIVGSSGVTSTVTFDSLTAADHDRVCTCTTRWKNTNWYNKNKTIKLFVSSSPPTTVSTKPNTNYSPIANVTSVRPESERQPDPDFPVGVVVGVVAAVLVVSAIIVVVVLLIRRRRGRRQNPPPESSPRTMDREEPAPQQNQPSTSQDSSSPYEDVDGPNAKPVIKPKPKPKPQQGASAAQAATTGDVHVTVSTRNVPQSVPQDSSPVSAADNKKKEGSVELPTGTPGVMKEKPKVGKKHAPNEAKQKGKRNNQTTEAPQRNQPGTSQISSSPYEDVDGPSAKPVTMPKPKPVTKPKPKPKPQHGASAAQVTSTDDKPEPEPEGSRTVDPDGLVYTAVTSTEEQLKKAKDPPPVREKTASAGLEFSKM